ncbi:hypothetical protein CY34DRAFT_808168 [Suillus luteus UH-Slu-Lm8-n1]|uniref:Uncharacterized protein n=1 Tax=Suillus luteus UH-Slu-Lm8-n1 TaxID=930992 RepID=A0A0C9ZPH7_9AGAM|nr:hypothetical protein CY34DRAFT_808168 [Suillus luteus UH-Slu-Lm8-n1]
MTIHVNLKMVNCSKPCDDMGRLTNSILWMHCGTDVHQMQSLAQRRIANVYPS